MTRAETPLRRRCRKSILPAMETTMTTLKTLTAAAALMLVASIGLALAALALSASADASWKCPNMYGTYYYYPTVTQCWNWQWDPNGPVEQAAAAEAQRAAVQRAREEEAAAQAQRAAELARLVVQREAARTQAIAAAKIAAEASPDNICREPKVAGKVLDDFNIMDWPDGRRAIDIEHLVTIANNGGENYVSCHGVWDLKDGRQIEGTLTLKTNVAGNPIAQWQQEGWEPTPNYSSGLKAKPEVLPAGKRSGPTIVPATTDAATTTSASFNDGAADRLAWETWFNQRRGARRRLLLGGTAVPEDPGRLRSAWRARPGRVRRSESSPDAERCAPEERSRLQGRVEQHTHQLGRVVNSLRPETAHAGADGEYFLVQAGPSKSGASPGGPWSRVGAGDPWCRSRERRHHATLPPYPG